MDRQQALIGVSWCGAQILMDRRDGREKKIVGVGTCIQ